MAKLIIELEEMTSEQIDSLVEWLHDMNLSDSTATGEPPNFKSIEIVEEI